MSASRRRRLHRSTPGLWAGWLLVCLLAATAGFFWLLCRETRLQRSADPVPKETAHNRR
jgi:hypothetical protein